MPIKNNILEDIQEISIDKLPILTILYENEKYNDNKYLNNKIQEARENLNNGISTCIIKNILEEKYKTGLKQYYISGYDVGNKNWEKFDKSNSSYYVGTLF